MGRRVITPCALDLVWAEDEPVEMWAEEVSLKRISVSQQDLFLQAKNDKPR